MPFPRVTFLQSHKMQYSQLILLCTMYHSWLLLFVPLFLQQSLLPFTLPYILFLSYGTLCMWYGEHCAAWGVENWKRRWRRRRRRSCVVVLLLGWASRDDDDTFLYTYFLHTNILLHLGFIPSIHNSYYYYTNSKTPKFCLLLLL